MAEVAPPPRPASGLRRVFLSPSDGRLRAGWRLLAHAALFGSLLIAFTLPIAVALAVAAYAAPGLSLDTLLMLGSAFASAIAITLATWFARRYIDRRSLLSLGMRFDRHTIADLLVGFAIPGLLMGLVFAGEWSLGWLQFEGWSWEGGAWGQTLLGLLAGLALYCAVGYEEELFSRGYQLQNLIEGSSLRLGLFLSALIFSILHLLNPGAGWASLLGILAAAYFLALGWVRTRQLWLSIGLHIGWNFFEGTVFGFPVSGLNLFRLMRHTASGPTWLTGGAFGPEAGLILLPVLAVGASLVWFYTRGRAEAATSGG